LGLSSLVNGLPEWVETLKQEKSLKFLQKLFLPFLLVKNSKKWLPRSNCFYCNLFVFNKTGCLHFTFPLVKGACFLLCCTSTRLPKYVSKTVTTRLWLYQLFGEVIQVTRISISGFMKKATTTNHLNNLQQKTSGCICLMEKQLFSVAVFNIHHCWCSWICRYK
jgi:hypothetical protein